MTTACPAYSLKAKGVAPSQCDLLMQVPIMHLAKRVIVSEPGHEPQLSGRSESGAARYYATLDDLGELTALQQGECSNAPGIWQASQVLWRTWMSGLSIHGLKRRWRVSLRKLWRAGCMLNRVVKVC